MNTTHTTEIDMRDMPMLSTVKILRGLVAMRNDAGFMAREKVDAEKMGEQADEFYAALIWHGFTPAQITDLVPGVEVFA